MKNVYHNKIEYLGLLETKNQNIWASHSGTYIHSPEKTAYSHRVFLKIQVYKNVIEQMYLAKPNWKGDYDHYPINYLFELTAEQQADLKELILFLSLTKPEEISLKEKNSYCNGLIVRFLLIALFTTTFIYFNYMNFVVLDEIFRSVSVLAASELLLFYAFNSYSNQEHVRNLLIELEQS